MTESVTAMTKLCRITNAIMRKYKPMCDPVEGNVQQALEELCYLQGLLKGSGLLSKEELEKD